MSYDPSRSLSKNLSTAEANSKLSFKGHIDRAAYCLAMKTHFHSMTGLRMSSVMTIGGQFEIPLKCATVLPPTLVNESLQHAAKGVASTMF